MKILKNIEGKHKQQLNAIEDQGNKQLNPIKNFSINSKKLKLIDSFSKISPGAEKLMSETKEDKMSSTVKNLFLWGANKKYFDFRVFKGPYEFSSYIYQKGSLKHAKVSQNRMLAKLDDLR